MATPPSAEPRPVPPTGAAVAPRRVALVAAVAAVYAQTLDFDFVKTWARSSGGRRRPSG